MPHSRPRQFVYPSLQAFGRKPRLVVYRPHSGFCGVSVSYSGHGLRIVKPRHLARVKATNLGILHSLTVHEPMCINLRTDNADTHVRIFGVYRAFSNFVEFTGSTDLGTTLHNKLKASR